MPGTVTGGPLSNQLHKHPALPQINKCHSKPKEANKTTVYIVYIQIVEQAQFVL